MLNAQNMTNIQQRITEYLPDSHQIIFAANQFLELPEETKFVIVLCVIPVIALTLWVLWRLLVTIVRIVLHVAPYAIVTAFWISMDPTQIDKILTLIVSIYCAANLPFFVSSLLCSVAVMFVSWEYSFAMLSGWVVGLVWVSLTNVWLSLTFQPKPQQSQQPQQQPFTINPPRMMVCLRNGGPHYYVNAVDVISSEDGRPQKFIRTVDRVYHRVL